MEDKEAIVGTRVCYKAKRRRVTFGTIINRNGDQVQLKLDEGEQRPWIHIKFLEKA